jgi:hypothetical protein
MKSMIKVIIISCLCLIALPLLVHAQRATSSSASSAGSQGRATASTGSAGVATASSAPASSARASTGGSSGESARPGSSGSYGGSGYGGGSASPVPSLRGTSFHSYGTYMQWQDFLFNLRMFYGFSMDRTRFLRNSEPLLIPRLASLAARRPLMASAELMVLVDELSSLLADARSGKVVDRKAIDTTADQIRRLTKQIRSDEALSFVDRRNNVDMAKAGNFDQLGLDAIERLREVALDLNSQLKTLSEQSQTSTVSVDYLSRPSFDSLTKGIDKLTRVIQNSARRL